MIAALVSPRMMRVGGGAVAQVAEVLAAFGLTRPLVVTDPYMVSSGLVRRCLDPMEKAGLHPVVFSATVPEPTDTIIEAGVAEHVKLEEGDALASLQGLDGPFDLVFLDADRPRYLAYLEAIVPKLRRGGLLVTDNVVSHAGELEGFLGRVKAHTELFSVTLPVGNGEELTYKL